MNKPPLGLISRIVFDERCNSERIEEILKAMARYTNAVEPIPYEWLEELSDRLNDAYGLDIRLE